MFRDLFVVLFTCLPNINWVIIVQAMTQATLLNLELWHLFQFIPGLPTSKKLVYMYLLKQNTDAVFGLLQNANYIAIPWYFTQKNPKKQT